MSKKKDDRATVKAARINTWGRVIAATIALVGVFVLYVIRKPEPSISLKKENNYVSIKRSNARKVDMLEAENKNPLYETGKTIEQNKTDKAKAEMPVTSINKSPSSYGPDVVIPKKSKTSRSENKTEIRPPYKKNKIETTILYKGKPVKNAYFSIRDCSTCKSTKSGINGIVTISVPEELIRSDNEHDFDVFAGDSLLYSRSMRFSNLNLNKY